MFTTKKPPRAGRPAWKCAEEFRRWLRKLPCPCCAHPGSERNPIIAAHVDHAGGKGTSTKVADKHCIPLCDDCHTKQHAMGWRSFELSLPLHDGVKLAEAYWLQWPGRVAWERELAESGQAVRA
ncbi:hypothetical protein GGQ80_002048 [Sphingomonas jinjuensis]|uniref:HNH endonuclease n=1 Tax=Sphingomonas jinjuensis TaxID=535907 RepID=A0A840FJK4_9SPHN|nr:hypothetical protein [Sphingomonas jinjuensis]MBB4154138.1 hypothetical protein [Sphingomonas jinjuensis]